jgi:hypothetical protein
MGSLMTIDYGTPVNFYAFSDGNSRNFIDFIPTGRAQDNKRYNVPGVDGNFLIRAGYRGEQVVCVVRYKGAPATIEAQWKADRDNFAVNPCSLTDNVILFPRCTLNDGSGERITGDMASGQSGNIWYNVRYSFTSEE